MNPNDKALAQSVVESLCMGARIGGVRFGPVLMILFDPPESNEKRIQGYSYLNLISSWQVFEYLPQSLPVNESDLKMGTVDEQLSIICGLRGITVTSVEIGEINPHLILHFENGSVLFINGNDDMYECWHVGAVHSKRTGTGLVMAIPGGDIAIWLPSDSVNKNSI